MSAIFELNFRRVLTIVILITLTLGILHSALDTDLHEVASVGKFHLETASKGNHLSGYSSHCPFDSSNSESVSRHCCHHTVLFTVTCPSYDLYEYSSSKSFVKTQTLSDRSCSPLDRPPIV